MHTIHTYMYGFCIYTTHMSYIYHLLHTIALPHPHSRRSRRWAISCRRLCTRPLGRCSPHPGLWRRSPFPHLLLPSRKPWHRHSPFTIQTPPPVDWPGPCHPNQHLGGRGQRAGGGLMGRGSEAEHSVLSTNRNAATPQRFRVIGF